MEDLWTILFFGAGIWVALELLGYKINAITLVIGALLLAAFMSNIAFILAQDAIMGLAIVVLLAFAAQYLYRVTFTQGLAAITIAWLVGTILVNGGL